MMGRGGAMGGNPMMGRGGIGMPLGKGGRRNINRGRPKRVSVKRNVRVDEDFEEEEVLTLPQPQSQIDAGKILAWFHTRDIKYGREYRCRFRMVFVNPLLTYSQNLEKDHKQDAETKYVKSKWSPWSDAVSVYRQLDFFVTGGFAPKKSLSVTVFAKILGQRVQVPFSNVFVGEKIGEKRKVDVINPATDELEETTLDLDTGAIPLEINFNKSVLRDGRVRRDGIEMVYLDVQGKIRSRMAYSDKSSTRFKKLRQEAQDTKKKIRIYQDAAVGIVRETTEEKRARLKAEKEEKRRRRATQRKGGTDERGGGPGRMPGGRGVGIQNPRGGRGRGVGRP